MENLNPNDHSHATAATLTKSIESMHGSSGAARYLVNQLHLRPVETTRGVEAPKILMNNSNHGNAGSTNASFSGHHQIGSRMSGIGDKLRPLLEQNKFAVPSSQKHEQGVSKSGVSSASGI